MNRHTPVIPSFWRKLRDKWLLMTELEQQVLVIVLSLFSMGLLLKAVHAGLLF